MTIEKPLLSVCIRAYNQGKYISEAIDGALIQKTTFPFEIIISDDFSSDETPRILADYLGKYPDLVKVLENNTNIGGTQNLKQIIMASEAKYIALCDGDDYWTDHYKLQKQVDFLESHPEYVVCFHNVINRYENNQIKPTLFNTLDFPSHITLENLIKNKWFLPINSEVFVRDCLFFPDWYDRVMNDDYVINLVLAISGPFCYMPDLMAVYRHHNNNESKIYSDLDLFNKNLLYILENIRYLYPEENQYLFEDKINEIKYILNQLKLDNKFPVLKYTRLRTYRKLLGKLLRIQRRE